MYVNDIQIFVQDMFYLPQMTLGVVNKAELQVQGLVPNAGHKPVAPSLNTPAVDLRTVLRAKFENMLFFSITRMKMIWNMPDF